MILVENWISNAHNHPGQIIKFGVSPLVSASAVSLSCQDFPVYLHQIQLASGLQISYILPIHWDRGDKVIDVLSLVHSCIGWPDTYNCHSS